MYKLKKVNHDVVKSNIDKIVTIVEKVPNIKLIYLFGSYATGSVAPVSDIDIAFYVEGLNDDLETLIYYEITSLLQTDEIDIVYLNKVSASFANEIIKTGKLLYCADETLRIEYESRILVEYLDFKPFQDFFSKEFLKRISKEGLGKSGYKIAKTD